MTVLPIPGFAPYYASSEGEIYRLHDSGELRPMKQRVQNSGYLYFRHPSAWKTVHRMVCAAFHGSAPKGPYECRHINGKKRDNRAVNLCWGTRNQNFNDSVRQGKLKLTPDLVRRIRRHLMLGAGMSELAAVFNVSYHTIYYLAQGLTWRKRIHGMTDEFRDWQRKALAKAS
jgi:hypothetical protein